MTLGEVCTFYSGTGFPNDFQGLSSGEYPFYKVGDISRNVQDGNVYLSFCDNYIDGSVVEKLNGVILPSKTVVFAKIGEALRLNRRAITSQFCLVDNNVMGIMPKEIHLTLEYFFQYMLGLDMSKYSASTTMPSVRKSTLQAVKMLVPPKELQDNFSKLFWQSDKSKFNVSNRNLSRCLEARNLTRVFFRKNVKS